MTKRRRGSLIHLDEQRDSTKRASLQSGAAHFGKPLKAKEQTICHGRLGEDSRESIGVSTRFELIWGSISG